MNKVTRTSFLDDDADDDPDDDMDNPAGADPTQDDSNTPAADFTPIGEGMDMWGGSDMQEVTLTNLLIKTVYKVKDMTKMK